MHDVNNLHMLLFEVMLEKEKEKITVDAFQEEK